jgi:hypothetical protein
MGGPRSASWMPSPAGRVTTGSTFHPGTKFMGFDLAEWLQARLADTVERCDEA